MADKIVMPQGGQDLQFGTVVRWLKQEGEAVRKGELVCEVETEKAVFEVNAPRDGVLLKILKGDGEEAEVLSAIGFIGEEGETITIEAEKPVSVEAAPSPGEKTTLTAQRMPGEKVRISPKARKLARDNGIDITSLSSDRPDGKITTEIVQAVIRSSGSTATAFDTSRGRSVKMGKVQRIAAERLSRSWREAPHFFVSVSADVTELLAMRSAFNAQHVGNKISINDLVVKAVAIALNDIPEVNASYYDRDTIILWDDINIGIATSTDDGLLVPVLVHADQLTLEEIAASARKLIADARSGKLSTDVPSRFTISNLGPHGVERFTAIINPPESAILAVASAHKKAVVDAQGAIVARDMLEMTLSLDHRVGDGALAAAFINRVKSLLEDAQRLWDGD